MGFLGIPPSVSTNPPVSVPQKPDANNGRKQVINHILSRLMPEVSGNSKINSKSNSSVQGKLDMNTLLKTAGIAFSQRLNPEIPQAFGQLDTMA